MEEEPAVETWALYLALQKTTDTSQQAPPCPSQAQKTQKMQKAPLYRYMATEDI
jgi:hypothetical protein